jgi:uncharacterized membrane protein
MVIPVLEGLVVKHLFTDALGGLFTFINLGRSERDTVVWSSAYLQGSRKDTLLTSKLINFSLEAISSRNSACQLMW